MITQTIKGVELSFESVPDGFSPRHIDAGTLAMLSFADFRPTDRILDLGCGYGVVGITAAKFADPSGVFLLDISEAAVRSARLNAARNGVAGVTVIQSDGFDALDETGFDLILSNPPYHTDFSVARRFIEKGFNRLKLGGKLLMVTKRKEWYKNKLTAIFGGVKIREKDGYFVFEAEKRDFRYKNKP